MSKGRDVEVEVLTRLEIREKLIAALDLSPQTFSGMTLEEIVQMVGEANRSLRQRIDDTVAHSNKVTVSYLQDASLAYAAIARAGEHADGDPKDAQKALQDLRDWYLTKFMEGLKGASDEGA